MITDEERLLRIERALADLVILNDTVPVIVEGKRDVAALRRLGLRGDILTLNTGAPLIQFCDRLAAGHQEVVLLPDWDRTGGTLMRRMREILRGRVKGNREIRKAFAVWSEVRDVESLPTYLRSLRARVALRTREEDDRSSRHGAPTRAGEP